MKTNKVILAICLAAFVGQVVASSPRPASPLSDLAQEELLRKGVVAVTQASINERVGQIDELKAENAALKAAAAKSCLTTASESLAGALLKPVCTVRGCEVTVGKLVAGSLAAGVATAGVFAVGKSGKLTDLKAKLPSLPTGLFTRRK